MQQTEPTILVLDDDPLQVDLTTAILKQSGFDAVGTTDPDEAIKLVETNAAIGVLLSDVMMPKASGPEVVRRAQRIRDGELRVVFMTGGFADVPFRQTDRILEKPWSRSQLVGEIRRALSEPAPYVAWNGPERRRRAA